MKRVKLFLFLLSLCVCTSSYGQSPLVINGIYKAYEHSADDWPWIVRNWSILRYFGGFGTNVTEDMTLEPSLSIQAGTETDGTLGHFHWIYRASLAFDFSPLPDNAVIDSVVLDIYISYNSGSSGIAIFAPSRYEGGFETDYTNVVNGYTGPDAITTSAYTLGIGWEEFNLNNTLPAHLNGKYAVYGLVEYNHDYLNNVPDLHENPLLTINLEEPYPPRLTIYYHSTPSPSPKKIKIIGII